jgi:hypothetical protein
MRGNALRGNAEHGVTLDLVACAIIARGARAKARGTSGAHSRRLLRGSGTESLLRPKRFVQGGSPRPARLVPVTRCSRVARGGAPSSSIPAVLGSVLRSAARGHVRAMRAPMCGLVPYIGVVHGATSRQHVTLQACVLPRDGTSLQSRFRGGGSPLVRGSCRAFSVAEIGIAIVRFVVSLPLVTRAGTAPQGESAGRSGTFAGRSTSLLPSRLVHRSRGCVPRRLGAEPFPRRESGRRSATERSRSTVIHGPGEYPARKVDGGPSAARRRETQRPRRKSGIGRTV